MRSAGYGVVVAAIALLAGCIFADNADFDDDVAGASEDGAADADCTSTARAPLVYHLCAERRTWEDARDACLALGDGVDLASIEDESEAAFVAGVLSDSVWIGGQFEGGTWRWADATPWSFTAWSANRPSGDPELNRLEMSPSSSWTDSHPGNPLPFLCKGPGSG